MKTSFILVLAVVFAFRVSLDAAEPAKPKPAPPQPTSADISFGPHDVGCSRDWANTASNDPIEHESSLVTCVAAYRCQPTFDPQRMQE
jgi:hypothetical protein